MSKTNGQKCLKKGKEDEVALAIAMALNENNDEVNAAIAMALHKHLDGFVHDEESFVLTIKSKESEWASKRDRMTLIR